MREEKKNANIPFRCTEERRRELKMLAAQRGQTVQGLLEQALELLEGRKAPPPERPRHERWHAALDELLDKGPQPVRNAIQALLRLSADDR
jgi:hypothetical protein